MVINNDIFSAAYTVCEKEDTADVSDIPKSELVSSSNPEDTPNAMTSVGWQPNDRDNNTFFGFVLPETVLFMDLIFDSKNVDEVRIVITTVDKNVVLDEKTIQVS